MNQHLENARGYIAQGEAYYHKAAEEMLAAQSDGMTVKEIASALGRSTGWVSSITSWHVQNTERSPFSGQYDRVRDSLASAAAKKNPQAIVEAITKAPPEARREIMRGIAKEPALNAEMEREQIQHVGRPAARENEREWRRQGTDGWLSLARPLIRADAALKDAVEIARDITVDDETARGVLLERIERIKLLADWLESHVDGGAAFDEALEALLAEAGE